MHRHTNSGRFDELDVAALWFSSAQLGGFPPDEVEAGMISTTSRGSEEETKMETGATA